MKPLERQFRDSTELEALMAQTGESSLDATFNQHLRGALIEQWFRIQNTRQRTKVAQRCAAQSFDKSACSHDRTAKSYEEMAELGEGNQYLERAARHREFAHEDRRIADRLRRMAGD